MPWYHLSLYVQTRARPRWMRLVFRVQALSPGLKLSRMVSLQQAGKGQELAGKAAPLDP